ncbi:amino acid/amide ABC transporter ATP-binding protein 1, HAAT family [Gemmobacter megaterium]|uniref:Amino acid/amide ABC transporter ATP-binding protein 1, HAAT family n=1 Tax=Gemmobacter megaterium TaxID=1086013 RepID=A0A1N7NYJ9_9RHOB|nr:ABC transporter ATP-binding protein [Gemmobacter megaterium]GGE15781.1 ABC transporter ATP-binding protein [Gemmobacter megaterium]SIT03417.1 amino acid/amide ABC transporter ATP-binding protein 1, HAAT family [Gemmobacter megaterium]
MTLLEVRHITKRFGGIVALNDVSLSVAKGEILGLMGANGAGKTTLFSVIAGHAAPTSGEVLFKGQRLTGLSPARICRQGICRTFQIVRPMAGLSVAENVRVAALYGAHALRGAQVGARVAEALAAVGLADQRDTLAGALTLSGQKRLEIARALATGAELVMLDEVMAGLNPTEIAAMLDTLSSLRRDRGLTFVIVEHVIGALMTLSDRILVLHHGEEIASGTPQEIGRNAQVAEVYFG